MKKKLALSMVCGILAIFIIFVSNNFASEIHVYPEESIQAAINDADDNDVIIVHEGIYTETINFLGKAIIIKSIDPNDKALVAATIIDGGQAGSVVTFEGNEISDSMLSGFMIQNGKVMDYGGGGIYCKDSSPTIANCIISGNSARGWGYSFMGSGIFCSNASPTITNCIITENLGNEGGGGIHCFVSSPIITDCTISRNGNNNEGGGIHCAYSSSPTIANCTITENGAMQRGGGIYCRFSSPIISNCIINKNFTLKYGGGVYCLSSSPSITNCIIVENWSKNGGGMYCDHSSPTITNCVIAKNSTKDGGGGMYCSSSSPALINCILWNNTILWGKMLNEIDIIENSEPIVIYSNIQSGYAGEGNIDIDPLFVDPNKGDYHLQKDSPCIDAGDPNYSIFEDKDGIPRPQDGNCDGLFIADMGAYEYIDTEPPIVNAGKDQIIIEKFDGFSNWTSNWRSLLWYTRIISYATDIQITLKAEAYDNCTNEDNLIYVWYKDGIQIGSQSLLNKIFSLGTHELRITVKDEAGNISSDTVVVNIWDIKPILSDSVWPWSVAARDIWSDINIVSWP